MPNLRKRIDDAEAELRRSFDAQAMGMPAYDDSLTDLHHGGKIPVSDVEMVYGYLLTKFMRADDAMRSRLDVAIILFEELWPEDTARWKARFAPRGE